jgi:S-adenosylmethionine/arginine decarboxylase-like enzyme
MHQSSGWSKRYAVVAAQSSGAPNGGEAETRAHTMTPNADVAATECGLAAPIGPDRAWGMSSSVDLYRCDPFTIRSRDRIREYVLRLCDLIQMRRYGECQIVNFGEGRVAGYSMTQLIETSLISGHFANESNAAYLDIFSCKPFEPGLVERFSREFFSAHASVVHTTLRQ